MDFRIGYHSCFNFLGISIVPYFLKEAMFWAIWVCSIVPAKIYHISIVPRFLKESRIWEVV